MQDIHLWKIKTEISNTSKQTTHYNPDDDKLDLIYDRSQIRVRLPTIAQPYGPVLHQHKKTTVLNMLPPNNYY